MKKMLYEIMFFSLIGLLILLCTKTPTFEKYFCLFISIIAIIIVRLKLKYNNKLYK